MQLLNRARIGDKVAVNDLCARYGPRLQTVVRLRLGRRLRSKLESMDVVQDALVAALPHVQVKPFESGAAFFHWLTTILENRVRDLADHFSAGKRDTAREQRQANAAAGDGGSVFDPIGQAGTFTTPSQIIGMGEEVERLETAIDSLPDDQREALILVRYEGMSFAQAGAALGRSPDAVRMLVSRAIIKLGLILTPAKDAGGTAAK